MRTLFNLISTRLQPGETDEGNPEAVSTASFPVAVGKPLKRFSPTLPQHTGLKPGANERWSPVALIVLALLVVCAMAFAEETNATANADTAYTRTINQRADKIVVTLGVSDTNKAVRVRDIIAQQYRDLSKIHEVRDAQIEEAKEKAGVDKAAANAATQAIRDETKPRLDKLHGEFLARLSSELSPEQVDKVKDGLTYGVVPLTYGVYLKMYPELTDEQKAQIKAWLVEARELAMDGSTSDEKHGVFGKYKGKINNYLSKAGYDAKKAEQNLKKPAPSASETKSK